MDHFPFMSQICPIEYPTLFSFGMPNWKKTVVDLYGYYLTKEHEEILYY